MTDAAPEQGSADSAGEPRVFTGAVELLAARDQVLGSSDWLMIDQFAEAAANALTWTGPS